LYATELCYLPWTAFSSLYTFLLNNVSYENGILLCSILSKKCEENFKKSGGFDAIKKNDTDYNLLV